MATRSPMPIPSAPPEPPSPMTTQTIGVSIWLIAIRFSAMIDGLAALLGGDARDRRPGCR